MRAIQTEYKGALFRSRLEARWAAMFDRLDWHWEYEPFDCDGWIPDFALVGANEMALVEVKPISHFDQNVADKIFRACPKIEAPCPGLTPPWEKEPSEMVPKHELLILGCTPFVASCDKSPSCDIPLGYLCERNECTWDHAVLGRWSDGNGKIGFCHATGTFNDRISGGYDGGHYGNGKVSQLEIQHLWNQAGRQVRWKGR